MGHMSDEEFLKSIRVKREIKRHIETVNKHLNHWEEVRAFRIIPVTPTIKEGELTPTMKIRREVLLKKYSRLIDSIYVEEDA
jgi:long-chain acyl-CoA synthetase